MHEKILALATAIASPRQAEEPVLEALCAAAEADLAKRLRPGVSAEDCPDAFSCAAALLAAAGLLPCREANGVNAFTVGEVSIQSGGTEQGEASEALRRQAAALIAPFLSDDSFAFVGVRG